MFNLATLEALVADVTHLKNPEMTKRVVATKLVGSVASIFSLESTEIELGYIESPNKYIEPLRSSIVYLTQLYELLELNRLEYAKAYNLESMLFHLTSVYAHSVNHQSDLNYEQRATRLSISMDMLFSLLESIMTKVGITYADLFPYESE